MNKVIPVLLVLFFLSACGSDSSNNGNNSPDTGNKDTVKLPPAPIQANGNSRELAESATLGVIQAKVVRDATALFPLANMITDPNNKIVELPDGGATNEIFPPRDCLNEDGKVQLGASLESSGVAVFYDNCNVGEDTILTGKIYIFYASYYTNPEKHVLGHYDLTINKGDQVDYIDSIRIECPKDTSGSKLMFPNKDICIYTSDYKAINGISYRLDRPIMEGDSSEGYRIYTDVINEDQGTMNIASSGLLFNCDNKFPSSGSIDYSTKEYSANLTFPNCNEYTLTEDGVSQTYSWDLDQEPK